VPAKSWKVRERKLRDTKLRTVTSSRRVIGKVEVHRKERRHGKSFKFVLATARVARCSCWRSGKKGEIGVVQGEGARGVEGLPARAARANHIGSAKMERAVDSAVKEGTRMGLRCRRGDSIRGDRSRQFRRQARAGKH